MIVICINPPPVDGKAYKPWRLRDSPESIAAGEAAHPELSKTAFVSPFFLFIPPGQIPPIVSHDIPTRK